MLSVWLRQPISVFLRLIVSDVDKAVEVLRVKELCRDVDRCGLSFRVPSCPASLAVVLEYLAEEQIFIEYVCLCTSRSGSCVVIKPNDMSQCLKVLEAHHCHVLAKEEL